MALVLLELSSNRGEAALTETTVSPPDLRRANSSVLLSSPLGASLLVATRGQKEARNSDRPRLS